MNQSISQARPGSDKQPLSARKNSQAGYLRLLVEVLMEGESLQRPALAQRVGLSRLAVSELLAGLEVRGFVRVGGALGGAPGRSQLSYALKADAALVLGFDVGGTKVAGAIADLRGHILAEATEPTVQAGAAELVQQLARMSDGLCRAADLPRFRLRMGAIGVPAAVHPETAELSLAGNLAGIEGRDLRSGLKDALGIPVLIDNDVNLALLAEVGHGSAHGRLNAVLIALGTGIGGALMINGHLLRGAHGGAGEIGYMPLWRIVDPGVPPLEEQVGEGGIRRAYAALGGSIDHSVRDIFSAAQEGDARAAQVLDEVAGHVARATLATLALLDPDLVIFGGSIGARPEFVARIKAHIGAAWPRSVDVVATQSGGRAGLLGALELARNHLLEELFGALPRR